MEQLAISWVLRDQCMASALLTTTDESHLAGVREAVHRTEFTAEELAALDVCCPNPAFTGLSVPDVTTCT
ncbi:hypothetical protein ACIQ6V_30335 [Streptomyces sp. NPDC096198]|uniref:hypothetical protein n=1 Tax=Streptomyces sp. NPDC096198 TaxID=3366080 RepID=UPI0037F8E4FA